MILLLGASGYVGRAFADELRRRGDCFVPLTRRAMDYTHFELLFDYVRKMRPAFIINAAGFTGGANVEACEAARAETLYANTLLPQTIARVAVMTNTPWGHVSSSGVYAGAKVLANGSMRVERNLCRPELRRRWAEEPESIFGFTEWDEPNCTFRQVPCSFYSGTKALAEEAIRGIGQSYIWRPGLPFNGSAEPRNFLWTIQQNGRIQDGLTSISHVEDFARVCLDLWERRVPFGIYNLTNPGAVTIRQVIEMIQEIRKPGRGFDFCDDDAKAGNSESAAPLPQCVLDVRKLLNAGVAIRPAEAALEEALRNWRAMMATPELVCP